MSEGESLVKRSSLDPFTEIYALLSLSNKLNAVQRK